MGWFLLGVTVGIGIAIAIAVDALELEGTV